MAQPRKSGSPGPIGEGRWLVFIVIFVLFCFAFAILDAILRAL